MKSRALLLVLGFLAFPAAAIDTGLAFEDPELQARYEDITGQVRCLQCQNESLRSSNAFLAADLRREIRRMLEEGMTDAEIYDFLVERYGEFVLYSPKMSGKTLVLWIAPGILLLFGGGLLFNILRRRAALPIDDDESAAEV
ncbi:MAG: cytochrome c-type biogenesis protein CcmH [Woeseiaceae bacterium]|nr:cytochrome c-type biogenesis protein CcmH [Woeseiaceae bacterium]